MTESIIVALISGGLAFAGVVYSKKQGDQKGITDVKIELLKHQSISDTKIEELTREVREHNNFAKRLPVIEEQIKVINHRIADLEKGEK